MTLFDYLSDWDRRTPPRGNASGFAQHISGAPTANTSPFFIFTLDDTNTKVYINPNRDGSSWVELASADVLAPITTTV